MRKRSLYTGKKVQPVSPAAAHGTTPGIISALSISLCLIVFSASGCDISPDFFTPPSVRAVRGDVAEKKLSDLEKRVKKYEKIINAKINAGEQLADVYESMAIIFMQKGNWQQAILFLEKAIAEGNASDNVHKNLAVAYANRGKELLSKEDYEKAEHHYLRAVELNENNYEALYGYGLFLFYVREKKDEGLELIDRVTRMQPDFYQARMALARLYYELEMPVKSLEIYKGLLDELSKGDKFRDMQADAIANITRITEESAGEKSE